MKIKVYAPLFGDTGLLAKNGYLKLPEGALLRDLYKTLKIPLLLRNSIVCQVNYERSKASRKLVEGDIVSFVGPLSGG